MLLEIVFEILEQIFGHQFEYFVKKKLVHWIVKKVTSNPESEFHLNSEVKFFCLKPNLIYLIIEKLLELHDCQICPYANPA